MSFKELRKQSGMTQQQFADYFKIPKRTIENWDAGVNKCPQYLLDLMKYKLEHNVAQYHRKSTKKPSTDDTTEIPTYHTRCNECGVELMCLDSVKEYLDKCPCCGAKLDK